MKHLAPTVLGTALLVGASGCGGCGSKAPEPVAQQDASSTASPSDSAAAASAWAARHARDDAGHLVPRTMPPPPDPSAVPTQTGRDPDWDLDSDDPARDYVRRYVVATRRYGDRIDCIDIGSSKPAGDKRTVEVKNAACADAGAPGAQRDVFVVDVAGDRLSVDDKSKRDALVLWPDGSDPEGPPKPVVDVGNLQKWSGPVKQALANALLVPVRVQAYGRGTYSVVTLAGWHGSITPKGPPDALRALASEVCKADGQMPMGIFAGVDRSTLLRLRCPGSFRWDKL